MAGNKVGGENIRLKIGNEMKRKQRLGKKYRLCQAGTVGLVAGHWTWSCR